jgi:Xaa-Pro aminopeptidase
MFSANTYSQRRLQLKKTVGTGLILLPANPLIPFNYTANTYHFRQDSTFLYYCGHQLPGLFVVLDADNGQEILFGHEPSMDDVIWEGPLPALAELGDRIGIQQCLPIEQLPAYLQIASAANRTFHYLSPYHTALQLELLKMLGQTQLLSSESLIKAIVAQRSSKSAEEIAEMEKALGVTQQIYQFAMTETRQGRFEYEIVGGVEGIAKAHHGTMAYHPIFSVNGHVLHNHYHGNQLKNGQWIVADLGAEAPSGYASDLTRTWPVSGKFSETQKEIYQSVLAAYQRAVEALRPGITYRECHLLAWETIAEGLKNMGVLKGDPAEMAQLGVPGLFMPHGLGHMIGLDVHDMENLGEQFVGYAEHQERSTLLGLRSLRLAKQLEQGFVLTVEPGIYFIPPLIERWENTGMFKDFIQYNRLKQLQGEGGCRIEDNYLITQDGSRKLGPPVPQSIAEVEAAIG